MNLEFWKLFGLAVLFLWIVLMIVGFCLDKWEDYRQRKAEQVVPGFVRVAPLDERHLRIVSRTGARR